MNKTIYRVCPVCSRDNLHCNHSKYSKNEWKIKECTGCGLVYLENAPIYESLVKDLSWEKTSKIEKYEKWNREPFKQSVSDVLKRIRRRYLKRDKLFQLIKKCFDRGNILDIGCASGSVLSRLDSRHIPFGIEISEYLAKKGNKKIQKKGGYILQSDAISGIGKFEDDFFAGIIMSAFLEHEIEPKGLLQECFRTLKYTGKAIIKVPNYSCLNRALRGTKWCGFRYPEHVNYFTPKILRNICEEAGFTIDKFDFFDRHPLSDNMWIVIRKDRTGRQTV